MPARSVSKRTRFEVFKRDGFMCVYCGANPMMSPLHVDHVIALANGGTNSPSNLVTACKDCNQGKGAVSLSKRPLAVPIITQADKDHAKQILEFLAIQREVEKAKKSAVDVLANQWEQIIGPLTQEMYDRLGRIMQQWSLEQITEAMRMVGKKMGTAGEEFNPTYALKQTKYFYGILRRWREQGEVW